MKSETKPESGVRAREALRWRQGRANLAPEMLAVEEPLEIRLGGRRFTVTMRTPGHDEELVTGFLLAEGFVESHEDINRIIRVPDNKGAPERNVVDVVLRVPDDEMRDRLHRN